MGRAFQGLARIDFRLPITQVACGQRPESTPQLLPLPTRASGYAIYLLGPQLPPLCIGHVNTGQICADVCKACGQLFNNRGCPAPAVFYPWHLFHPICVSKLIFIVKRDHSKEIILMNSYYLKKSRIQSHEYISVSYLLLDFFLLSE